LPWREFQEGFRKAGARTRAKTKYRDLSTTAAKAPPPVEMTFVEFGIEDHEQKQRPKQKQIPAG
jgi:hypothetical protein